jgi:hypothetical protein
MSINTAFSSVHPSYSDKVPVDTVPFYPGGQYNSDIPKPNDHLSYPVGFLPAHYNELINYLTILSQKSDRIKMVEHGKTHEGRKLYNLFVSSPENIGKLDNIKSNHNQLSDPGSMTTTELNSFVEDLPAVAWLGHSIHGDEISGVDAAIQLAYQLAAGTDSTTMHLLENVLIIIDPIENPDGRERYLSMLDTYRSHVPNYDRNAQQHQGVWPFGRGNHYLFDLNRDWILVNQPETKGKLKTITEWHPQLVVDAHEMGSNATYLFSPPRQPINYNTPSNVYKWWGVFNKDQATAFDQRGWPYYSREWNEQWYPGYGSAWPTFFGVIGILYEQAGVDGSFVKQRDDYLLTYHESVNHQFRSALSNLFTLANNRKDIMIDYFKARKQIVEDGKKSNLSFLFVPDKDKVKFNYFLESLLNQGIKVEKSTQQFTVPSVIDIYGNKSTSKKFPIETYIVKTDQPSGALAKAILEFDPHLKIEFLKEERRELEKHNDTRVYDVNSWSVPIAYNLDAYETKSSFSVETEKVTEVIKLTGELINPDAVFGFVVNMVGEKTYLMLNRLFGEQLTMFASEKAFKVDGYSFNSGAILIRKRGNTKDLPNVLDKLAKDVGLNIYGVNTGLSTEGSHLGAGTFRLLKQPKIAIITGNLLSTTSFGSLWFTIDKQLNIPHSLISFPNFNFTNIDQYNLIVFPEIWYYEGLNSLDKEKINNWVKRGGTIVGMGNIMAWMADTTNNISNVKIKRQVLDKLAQYSNNVNREIAAEAPIVDTMNIWHPKKSTTATKKEDEPSFPSKKKAEEIDEWQRRFMPRGVYMKVELDTEDWLAFGMNKYVPASLYTDYAFMSESPVKTVGRFTTDETKLRVSGLLWPEARARWAGTSYVTRESVGKGQLILFAAHPNFRAYNFGIRQLFVNAILYGPGLGSSFEGPYIQQD